MKINKILILFTVLTLIIACNKKQEHKNFKEISVEELEVTPFDYYNELNYTGYKLATTKSEKGKPCILNTYDVEDIVNEDDAENIITNFERTAIAVRDKDAPNQEFDIIAKIETPKKFYRNFKDNFLVDGTVSENRQNLTLLDLVSFKRTNKYAYIEDTQGLEEIADYKLYNEKNEKMILKEYQGYQGGYHFVKDEKTGKEFVKCVLPSFSFSYYNLITFNKLKGYIDFEIEVPYKLEIVTIDHNDVGSIIKINGVDIEILAFENNVLHLKFEDNSYVDTKFTIFSKSCFESYQFYYSDYILCRENPNLSENEFEKLKAKYYRKDLEKKINQPYVFVIHFSNNIDEVKLIAKKEDKILRKKIRVKVDL